MLDIEKEIGNILYLYNEYIVPSIFSGAFQMYTQATTPQSRVDVAYENLVQRIVFMDYSPGQHLEERQLISDLQIGRTPIREALLRLQAEMMVESKPKNGYFVRPITLQSIRSAFEALYLMEGGLANLAVKNDCTQEIQFMKLANSKMKEHVQKKNIRALVEANETFHAYLAQCSQNEYLIYALNRVRTEIKRLAYLSFSQDINPEQSLNAHYKSVLQEHEDMVYALNQKNATELHKLIIAHNHAFHQRIMQSVMS